jgi:glycerophosphoryl diester phosphodiesterase
MKRVLAFVLCALMLIALLTAIPLTEAFAEEAKVITNASPAVTGDVGKDIDLTPYSVELSDGTVLKSPEWTLDGKAVTTVKFDTKGVYKLTASSDGKSRTVYAVIKNADETEYVLYENNFDAASDIEGLKKTSNGNVSVKDGVLVIDTTGKSNTILLMPEWLGDFGNYNIETSAAMISSADASRWFSICYRYQSPYYMHMCVRKSMSTPGGDGKTGGIESVGYDGTWRYLRSAGYEQDMTYGDFYKFNVSIYDNTLQYRVDGSVVVHIDDITTYGYNLKTMGGIGLQGNSSVMNFDYIKVTVATEAAKKPEVKDPLIAVEHTTTNLLNSVTNVATVSEADLETLLSGETKPNSVLVKYESVTAEKLDALYEICNEKGVIPGVYVNSEQDGTALTEWCSTNNFWDINVASENGDLLKAIRNKKNVLRTILFLNDIEGKTAQQIRETVRGYAVNVLAIPADASAKATVAALQELHVTVWSVGTEIDKIDAAWMIASGANGMVSDNHALITTVMSEVFGKNTLTKTPSIIGHRGNPSQAPENSIEGYLTAVQNGATEVETDIYLTKDGEIIIMHDNTLNRTTNYTGTKTVPQMTLEEIREYRLLNKDGSVSDSPVPTLKEMFEALKDTDVYYVIELKSGDETMVPVLYDLIKEYNVQHRVNIISFSGPVLKKTYDVDPIISAGYLSGSLTATAADMEALRINVFQLIKGAQVYNASVNINHANISKEFYTMLNDRGVTLWPWTFQTGTSMAFYNEFLWGVDGLTTDDAQLTKNTVMDFNVDKVGANTMAPGNTMEIKAEITTYGRVTSQAEGVNVVWLTENMGASYDPATGIFTAGSAEGKVAFMLSYSAKLPNGKQYVLYSQPVTVDVVAEPVEESVDVFKIACLSIIAVCSIATVVVLATGKKKKD